VKTIAEFWMILMCLLFWAVALPLAGLVEIGVLLTHPHHTARVPVSVSHSPAWKA